MRVKVRILEDDIKHEVEWIDNVISFDRLNKDRWSFVIDNGFKAMRKDISCIILECCQ